MPTFDDPLADASETSAALRGLAHATRAFENPADTYPVIGDLLAGVRSLRQVLDQVTAAHIAPRARAHDDAGNQHAGATFALAAADELHQAGILLDDVEARLDAASQHSGRIAWHPASPTELSNESLREGVSGEGAGVRWISVVFLQGDDADQVLDLIDRDGTDAAIEHLAGFDYGEETVQAALENGYVYDQPPTGQLDKTSTRDVYTLTYNPFLGHVSLLREHGALPDPALLGIITPASTVTAGAEAGACRAQVGTVSDPGSGPGARRWRLVHPEAGSYECAGVGAVTGPEDGRLHTAVLVGPEGERRRARKARRQAATRIETTARETRKADTKARWEAERAERRNTTYLPAAGEPGPAALRTPGRFRLPKHQDTSATLSGQYPFLAEGGLGSDGIFVGQDLYSGGSFVYDPWVLYRRGIITAPNVVLAGIVGSGKSSLAKSLYTRSLPFGRRVYVPGDPKGEHTAVAEAVGGRAIILGHGLSNRLNPLDEGHRPSTVSDAEWAMQVASRRRDLIGALAETVLDRPLSPLEHTAIDLAMRDAVRSAEVPILPMVVDRILTPNPADDEDGRLAEDGRLVGHALRRLVAGDLQGLFDGPSTVRFDPSLPMVSLDLSRVAENSTLISVLMTCSSAWMESALSDPNGGQRWVIYDEAWRLMAYPSLLRRMDAQWRLARHFGIANMLIFHKLSDLDNVGDQGSAMRALASSLLANAETRIVYRQEADQLGSTATALGLTGTEQKLLPGLGTGQGLWRIKDRSFVVQHQLHPAELATFDTTSRMTTDARDAQPGEAAATAGKAGEA